MIEFKCMCPQCVYWQFVIDTRRSTKILFVVWKVLLSLRHWYIYSFGITTLFWDLKYDLFCFSEISHCFF